MDRTLTGEALHHYILSSTMGEIAEHRLPLEDAQELPVDFHRSLHAASRRGIHPFDLNVDLDADWAAPARALTGGISWNPSRAVSSIERQRASSSGDATTTV